MDSNLRAGGNWFYGARVVHDRDLLGQETEAIDEMPAFSFLLGDMHPHVLSLPFGLLAAGLALEWLLWGASGQWKLTGQLTDEEGPHLELSLAGLRRAVVPCAVHTHRGRPRRAVISSTPGTFPFTCS